MKIRPIKPEDNQAIKHILQTDLKHFGLDIPGTAYFDSNLDKLNEFYDAQTNRAYFVVEDDQGKVMGGAGCAEFDWDNGIAELQKIYLDKKAQGFGLSYKLIALVEDFTKKAGYKKLYLETHHNLKAAIHVYTKSGYQKLAGPIKNSDHSGAMDGFFIKTL